MKAARVFLSPLPSLFLSRLQVPLSFYSPTLSPKRRAQMTSSMPADDVKPGDVAYCKLRNGTSTLGWYECGVLSYPRGEKGVVRVEVVEKLAPQLPDDRANGPAKKQLVSSADGASFTRSLVLAQTAAKALAAQTAGPRKRRQPSCWADEAESWSEETESAPEKKQRSMPTAPVCWTESSAEAEAEAKAKAKPTLAKRTELELSTESSAEAMEAALSMAEAVYDSRAPKTATGLFGVALDRRRLQRPYVARVWRGGKLVRLGTFATAENAALAVARSPEGALRLIGTRAVAAAEAAAAAGKEAAAVAVEATYCK